MVLVLNCRRRQLLWCLLKMTNLLPRARLPAAALMSRIVILRMMWVNNYSSMIVFCLFLSWLFWITWVCIYCPSRNELWYISSSPSHHVQFHYLKWNNIIFIWFWLFLYWVYDNIWVVKFFILCVKFSQVDVCCMNYQVKPAAKQPAKKPAETSSDDDSSSDEVCFLQSIVVIYAHRFFIIYKFRMVLVLNCHRRCLLK